MRAPDRASMPLIGMVMGAVLGFVGFGGYKGLSSPDVRWTDRASVLRKSESVDPPPAFRDWIG